MMNNTVAIDGIVESGLWPKDMAFGQNVKINPYQCPINAAKTNFNYSYLARVLALLASQLKKLEHRVRDPRCTSVGQFF